ncbi:MAG TPA: helix-turn-helix domain-containing protein [Rhizomicrobium sp.]|jgi:lambda repressor-like predicted transcriptional regulator
MAAAIDPYIIDTLMRDLVGHDRAPSSFVLYLWLWFRAGKSRRVGVSLQTMATETGLSKSSVQNALRRLRRRRLIVVHRAAATSACSYEVLEPWRLRSQNSALPPSRSGAQKRK